MIKYLINSHKFFVEKSRWYVGDQNRLKWCRRGLSAVSLEPELSIGKALYYPVAYVKFMLYSIHDGYYLHDRT